MISNVFNTDKVFLFFQIYLAVALAGIWISMIIWTIKDIEKRSRSWVAKILAPALVLLFFVFGLVIYLFIRPSLTLDNEFREKLNEEVLVRSLVKPHFCSDCQHEINSTWLYCPNCKKQLHKPCVKCGNILDILWDLCPYCGTENLRTFKDLSVDKIH